MKVWHYDVSFSEWSVACKWPWEVQGWWHYREMQGTCTVSMWKTTRKDWDDF